MADQRRNRNRRNRRPDDGLNEGYLWTLMKLAFLVLIVAVATTAYFRFFTTVSQNINSQDLKTNHFRNKDGQSRIEQQYKSEMTAMKRIIGKYSNTQKAGGNNETGEGFGKSTGTFLLETEENENEAIGEDEEEPELDEVDLAFANGLLHDIHETDESKRKIEMQLRVNELEGKLGRRLTKYLMTREEMDADSGLDEDKRQYYEFLNVRQGFVDSFIQRMRERKSENPTKYTRTPDDYTMTQKFLLLRKSFDGYVNQVWDSELKRMTIKLRPPSSQVKQKEEKSTIVPENEKDSEINEILEAIHWTPKFKFRQEMEEELEELKSLQGHPSPKVNEIDHIRNNFIYAEREKLSQMRQMGMSDNKRSPEDYSFMERQELSAAWDEYFQFYYKKNDGGDTEGTTELSLDDLDLIDDVIDAIEITPRYIDKIREQRKDERWQKRRTHSTLFSRDDEPSPFEKESTDAFMERINIIKKLQEDFIEQERLRISGPDRPRSISTLGKLKSNDEGEGSLEDNEDEDLYDDLDDLDIMRSYREPEEYSLTEKADLKKRFDLFTRRYLSKISLDVMPIPDSDITSLNTDALTTNKLDFLDDLIEDIHKVPSPAHEARLNVEAVTQKFVKRNPGDRESELRLEEFRMRRKFIAEERGRLVGALTKSRTPKTYTFDEKEELRCRWVDFSHKHWTQDKRSELAKLEQGRAKKSGKRKKEKEDEGVELSVYSWELVHHLIDEIFNQNNFNQREKLMKAFDEELINEREIKEQLIRQQGFELSAEDKIIYEFGRTSLKEFLKMRREFIDEEKLSFSEKNAGLKQFVMDTSEMIELFRRWSVKFNVYKTKVDKVFQTLGT